MRQIVTTMLLLVVPLFLTGCSLKSPTATSSTTPSPQAVASGKTDTASGANYLTVDPKAVDESIKANADLAAQKVKDWHTNAALYHVSVKLPGNLAVGQVAEVYTYGSTDEAYNWWTLNISDKTDKSVRAIIPKEDYLGTTVEPIPLQHWKMNYVEALQLAEVNGGSAYRASHPDSQVTLNLSVGQPRNYLWWSVEYDSLDTTSYKILVNPSTKEIVKP